MGCFLACFGGDGDRRRRRRKSPARSPPRSIHVAAVREASAADVVVREASPPLRGAKPSTLAAAVEVPDEAAADVVVKEVSPPLRGAKRSTLAEVVDEGAEEASLPASSPSSDADVAEEAVTDASSGKELRELIEQKASPVCSLLMEKQATPLPSPLKCSPVVTAIVSPQDSVECSPVVAAAVSTLDSELREVSEHGSRSSGKKKVTFDMNVTTYENAVLPYQEEEQPEEDEEHTQKTAVLPENHRYRNCSDSDDDVEDDYAEDEVYSDDSDEEENYMDCKIDLVEEEEMRNEENKQESHESLFSLSVSNDQQNDQEVSSPAPKSSGTSVAAESPLIMRNNLRDRRQYVHPVLNPVQNLSQWKEVKSRKTQAVPAKMLDKENVNLVKDVGARPDSSFASQTRMSPCVSGMKEVSVDASLSTWLNSSENSTAAKGQSSKSPCSISSVSREERPVLGVLTVDDLKQPPSSASSPRRSPRNDCEGDTILGTVGSYWRCTDQDNRYCSSKSDSGTNGIPNTTSKYREDKRVNWHSTPFNVRLDRAMKKTSA